MKAIIQRVKEARLTVSEELFSEIGEGLLVYVGIAKGDNAADVEFLARKIASLRLFNDENGRINNDVKEVSSQVLLVSNFTITANCRNGNRPSFDNAASPDDAKVLFDLLVEVLKDEGVRVKQGCFGAYMEIESLATGPVNVILDSGD
ncbi:MAG: D-aminoacyl-tRNA deacylase [Phycisphaerae bacterium]|jgi:D-tyrosyl-tRNA(Tyr) deacylase